MRNIAIITARGGSKRIPRKNIRDFMGKPMLSYAIKAAKESAIFDEIMVSTDDFEIAEIARKFGATVPFMRSEKNSDDFSTTYDVLEEVLWEYKSRGSVFEYLACIYPCVPFLTGKILNGAFTIFKDKKVDALVPVVRYSFPIQRAFRVNNDGLLEYREPQNILKRSQDLEPMFHDVGMFYFAKVSSLLGNKALVSGDVAYFEMHESQIQDIDTESDWKMMELKYRILNEI
jgi:N-acylneuraminate cytidylyltransferase